MSVAIINYGLGNLRSVYNAIEFIGGTSFIAETPAQLSDASHIILPGVGAFGEGMDNLNKSGWTEEINRQAKEAGKPFLGICLGMQLLASKGTEYGDNNGLGLIAGLVTKHVTGDRNIRIPHIGWNEVEIARPCRMYDGMENDDFYFVHSYVFKPDDEKAVTGYCEHGNRFAASVEQDNIWGAQFHPEKSQKAGLSLLKNFLKVPQC